MRHEDVTYVVRREVNRCGLLKRFQQDPLFNAYVHNGIYALCNLSEVLEEQGMDAPSTEKVLRHTVRRILEAHVTAEVRAHQAQQMLIDLKPLV